MNLHTDNGTKVIITQHPAMGTLLATVHPDAITREHAISLSAAEVGPSTLECTLYQSFHVAGDWYVQWQLITESQEEEL